MAFFDDFWKKQNPQDELNRDTPELSLVSNTTENVKRKNEYLKETLSGVSNAYSGINSSEADAVRNRVEFYNPDTTEERKIQLESEFVKMSPRDQLDSENIILWERNKEAQATINITKAALDANEQQREANLRDKNTIESAYAEAGVPVSDVSQGIISGILSGIKTSDGDLKSTALLAFAKGNGI